MKRAMIAALVLCCVGSVSAAPVPTPPQGVTAAVRMLLAVTEGRSNVNLDTLFTPDGAVIDEGAPFVWRGPHAGSAWWAYLHRKFAMANMRGFRVVAGTPTEYSQSGDQAYMIVPVWLTGSAGTKPFRKHGALTFTFRRVGGEWKIANDVWTTLFP